MSSLGGIYGLSGSGLDIDTMVKNLMKGQQAKADALLQKKTIAQWQKAAYNTIYDDISNFRTTLNNYKYQGILSPNKVSSSNTTVATVSANASAAEVNHSLVVAQLADGVKLTSTASLASVDRTSIAKQFYSGTTVDNISITITNGSRSATIAVDAGGTLNDFASKINKAGINVTANYDSTLDRFFVATTNSGAISSISFAGSNANGMDLLDRLKLPVVASTNMSSSSTVQTTLGFINPDSSLDTQFNNITDSTLKLTNTNGTTQTINITMGTTKLNDIIKAINDGTNATANFDPATGKFTITPTNGGTLSIEGSDQNAKDLFEQLHLPADFNAGSPTTSITSVFYKTPVTFDPTKALQSQFGEFSGFGFTDTFTLNIDDGSGTNTFEPVTITPATDSLQDMFDNIHAAVPNVIASFDSVTGKVTLQSENGKSLNFAGSQPAGINFLVNTLKLQQSGQDAFFKLDGVTLSEASNTFDISGVAYNLVGVSDNVGTGTIDEKLALGKVTSVNVTSDVDTAVNSIKSLVDSYNKILAEINGKLNEERYKDYLPLTDDQKSSMKESDVTAWNAKSQSGMLHHDSTLTSLVNTMRSAFTNSVSGIAGDYTSASSIGITTGDYTEDGKLHLDTIKLQKAINSNPDLLSQLFGNSGQTTTGGVTTTNTQSQGIVWRLHDGIKTAMDKLAQIAGTTMTTQYDSNSDYAKKIKNYTAQISNEETKFTRMESTYYKKFNAMEVALQQMNSQSSWLSSQLSSLGSSNG